MRRLICPLALSVLALSAAPVLAVTPVTPACDISDFREFYRAFAASVAVQEGATADPLRHWSMDLEGEEPELLETLVPLADVLWPVVPTLGSWEAAGYDIAFSEATPEGWTVQARGAGNGVLVTLRFEKDPCWQLVELRDESM